jgi:hypothetical protein
MRALIVSLCYLVAAHASFAQQPSPKDTPGPNPKAQKQQQQVKHAKPQNQRQIDSSPIPPRSGSRSIQGVQGNLHPNKPRHHQQSRLQGSPPAQNRSSYAEALQRYHRERHDCNWWRRNYTTIVLVGGGYYYWDAGYWYPAWGFDPGNEYYDYDGPIYTYGNLLPDQVIVNVQRALQQLGYYNGGISGALTTATRSAIAAYQEDNGLEVTAVVDAPTVESLGLI